MLGYTVITGKKLNIRKRKSKQQGASSRQSSLKKPYCITPNIPNDYVYFNGIPLIVEPRVSGYTNYVNTENMSYWQNSRVFLQTPNWSLQLDINSFCFLRISNIIMWELLASYISDKLRAAIYLLFICICICYEI